MFQSNTNEINRQNWLREVLSNVPAGSRLLDAGAGQGRNRAHCSHLNYVSQDFCQYVGKASAPAEGLQYEEWDTSKIDLISDITAIPAPDASFDVILCSEVLEHVPEPTHALDEFVRLLRPGGLLIVTAPFYSNVHMAPFYYCCGFSRYWYEYHLPLRGFQIKEIAPNGDWYELLLQEVTRLGGLERARGNWVWPLAYAYSILGIIYFKIRARRRAEDLASFGWQCIAQKTSELRK